MNIALKSITTNLSMSDETICFSANLYIDNKKIGTVMNRGHGGAHEFSGDWAAYRAANDWVVHNTEHTNSCDDAIEYMIDELVHDYNITQMIKRKIKTHLLITEKGNNDLFWGKLPKGISVTPEICNLYMEKTNPAATVLNMLPIPELVKIFKDSDT